jgi:hypothetical protein
MVKGKIEKAEVESEEGQVEEAGAESVEAKVESKEGEARTEEGEGVTEARTEEGEGVTEARTVEEAIEGNAGAGEVVTAKAAAVEAGAAEAGAVEGEAEAGKTEAEAAAVVKLNFLYKCKDLGKSINSFDCHTSQGQLEKIEDGFKLSYKSKKNVDKTLIITSIDKIYFSDKDNVEIEVIDTGNEKHKYFYIKKDDLYNLIENKYIDNNTKFTIELSILANSEIVTITRQNDDIGPTKKYTYNSKGSNRKHMLKIEKREDKTRKISINNKELGYTTIKIVEIEGENIIAIGIHKLKLNNENNLNHLKKILFII